MEKLEMLKIIKEKGIYSLIADNNPNMSKSDLIDIAKELEFAITQVSEEDFYQRVLDEFIDNIKDCWSSEIQAEEDKLVPVPMLKIHINEDTYMLNDFYVEGTKNDDLLGLVDAYVQEHKEDFSTWTYQELLGIYDGNEDYIDESSTPINGGEYYIGRIELVEEVLRRRD